MLPRGSARQRPASRTPRRCSTRPGRRTGTRSASCSIEPDSRRSERIGRLSWRCSTARESWREREDRHVEVARENLEVPGDLRHLLHPVLGRRARGHQLEVVHDDHPDRDLLLEEVANLATDLVRAVERREHPLGRCLVHFDLVSSDIIRVVRDTASSGAKKLPTAMRARRSRGARGWRTNPQHPTSVPRLQLPYMTRLSRRIGGFSSMDHSSLARPV